MTGEKGYFSFDKLTYLIHAVFFQGADSKGLVADAMIHEYHIVHVLLILFRANIHFIEQDNRRDMISLSRDENTINESKGGARLSQCGNDDYLVKVCRYDMFLAGKITCLANNIIRTR